MSQGDIRERMLREATRLFGERGYGSTSVREVVEAAGVTKPALYYHFGSKEELYLEVVGTHVRTISGLIEREIAGQEPVRERMGRFVSSYIRYILDHPCVMRLLATAQHPTEGGRPPVDLMSVHRRNGELLAGLVREGIRAGELREDLPLPCAAISFIGMLNLNCIAVLLGEVPRDPGLAEKIMDLFWNGAGR